MTIFRPLTHALFVALSLSVLSPVVFSVPQQGTAPSAAAPATPLLTRSATRHEVRHFGYGGTITVIGAPRGSITIEGWDKNEVDLTAEIEIQAPTEEDLQRLSVLNNFVFDEDSNHLRILSTGTHDKAFMKRVAKNFPKRLLGLPWKIDYRLRVPVLSDLEVNAGDGMIKLSGVEGAIQLTGRQADAQLTLTGGTVSVTVASGTVNVNLPGRSWRGAGLEVQLAVGDLNVEMANGLNAYVDIEVLRTGKINNSYPGFESRERTEMTDRSIKARSGTGGATLKFAVVEGSIAIKKKSEE